MLVSFFPQQQNAIGSLHNKDFGVFWASWAVPGTGSGNRFRVTGFAVPGNQFRGTRIRVSMGSDSFAVPRHRVPATKVPGSEGCLPEDSKVPETRGITKVPGSGDSVPKVPKVTVYFERALLYFERILCKLKIKCCTLKVYLCTLKV